MTLPQILEVVHRAYPDAFTRCCWDEEASRPIHGTGDTLAGFVVAEIAETYDQAADTATQLAEGERVLTRAGRTLSCLAAALRQQRIRPLEPTPKRKESS